MLVCRECANGLTVIATSWGPCFLFCYECRIWRLSLTTYQHYEAGINNWIAIFNERDESSGGDDSSGGDETSGSDDAPGGDGTSVGDETSGSDDAPGGYDSDEPFPRGPGNYEPKGFVVEEDDPAMAVIHSFFNVDHVPEPEIIDDHGPANEDLEDWLIPAPAGGLCPLVSHPEDIVTFDTADDGAVHRDLARLLAGICADDNTEIVFDDDVEDDYAHAI